MEWRRQSCARARGVTLLEILAVVALLAVTALVTIPGFAAWRARDRVDTGTHALLGSLAYASAEAVRRKARVTVCRADAALRCLPASAACATGKTDWSCGWAVLADQGGAAQLLRIQSALHGIRIASTLASFSFVPPAGRATGTLGNFDIAPDDVADAARGGRWRRCIRVAASGRARVTEGACT